MASRRTTTSDLASPGHLYTPRPERISASRRMRAAQDRASPEPVLVGGDMTSLNLLIEGDAGTALPLLSGPSSILGSYTGKIKLCYLDPPFNTGEAFAHYYDKLDRSSWRRVFREHLEALRPLLSPDASVWVHIDDSEQHIARVVLDEVFGYDAFVATIVWQKRTSRDNRKAFSSMHDYIHVYAPAGPKAWKKVRNGLADQGDFSNPDNDPRGPWRSVPMSVQAGHATRSQFYTLVSPGGVPHNPPAGRCWTYTQERLAELVADGRVYWPSGGKGKPRLKRYMSESVGLAPFTIWTAEEVGDNAQAKRALRAQFPDRETFDTPKPEGLLTRVLEVGSDPGDLVMDYYLGSGTTACVAEKLKRNWVGIERNGKLIQDFIAPRLGAAAYRHCRLYSDELEAIEA